MIPKETLRKLEVAEGVILGTTHCVECGRRFAALEEVPIEKRNSSAMQAVIGKCPTNSPKHHALNESTPVVSTKKSSKK